MARASWDFKTDSNQCVFSLSYGAGLQPAACGTDIIQLTRHQDQDHPGQGPADGGGEGEGGGVAGEDLGAAGHDYIAQEEGQGVEVQLEKDGQEGARVVGEEGAGAITAGGAGQVQGLSVWKLGQLATKARSEAKE